MKRFSHFCHRAARMKGLLAAAILFSLLVLSAPLVTINSKAGSGAWTLKEIRVFNALDGNAATITSERYDARGGSVVINVDGKVYDSCPGGYEKMRFNWSFPDNITQVTNGGAVSASLEVGQEAKSQNCGVQFLNRSVVVLNSAGSGPSRRFSPDEYRLIDGERFLTGNGFRAKGDDVRSGIGSIKINTHPFNPNQPLAYFSISIGLPGGELWYVYLYENAGGGSGGGNSLSTEDNVDRMGGDYKDFDLSQADPAACRDACAGEARCKAYTYVRPGVQGASARCWLKSSVPAATSSNCCVSGVRTQ